MALWYKWHFHFLPLLSSHCMPSQEAKSSTAPHTQNLRNYQPMAIVGWNMLVYIYKYKYIYIHIFSHLGVLKFRNWISLNFTHTILIQSFEIRINLLGKADPISSFWRSAWFPFCGELLFLSLESNLIHPTIGGWLVVGRATHGQGTANKVY